MDVATNWKAPDDETLEMIATALREALDADTLVEQRTRLEWVDSKMRVIELLVKARRKLGGNEAFGIWIGQNGLDHLGKTDRAAAINLGQDMDLCRAVLLDSRSISLEAIWRDNKWRYNAVPEGKNAAFALPIDRKTTTHEKLAPAQLAIGSIKPPKGSQSPLIEQFGREAGTTILAHYDRKTRTTARIIQKLNKEQGRKLADFLRATPGLPKSHNSDGDLGVATLWPSAPNALASQFRTGRTEAGALMHAIDRWKPEIAPLIAQWVAAGAPADVNSWYARIIPAPVAAAQKAEALANADAAISRTVADLVATIDEPRIDPTCRAAHKGPIRHHGAQIWPAPPGEKYGFDDAWYVTTIWLAFDRVMMRAEPSPRTRAAMFMKPIIGCFRNLNPQAGEILGRLLWAQHASPDLTGPDDNECPPYDSVQ